MDHWIVTPEDDPEFSSSDDSRIDFSEEESAEDCDEPDYDTRQASKFLSRLDRAHEIGGDCLEGDRDYAAASAR